MARTSAVILTLLCAFPAPLHAGRYPASGTQTFESYAIGATNLGDGTAISSNNGVASVQANGFGKGLMLTRDGTGGTLGSFKVPDLDPGREMAAFDATFTVRMTAGGTPADGWSLNVGPIPAGDGGGEGGYAMNNGLVIAWDTYDNGNDTPSIEVYANGVSVGNVPQSFIYDIMPRTVAVHWDSAGLDVTYNGVVIFNNLATPGFVPQAGYTFAFSGRTGGATQDTVLDDLVLATTPVAPLLTGGPVISEFLASNQNGIEDENGDQPDWIEIYNGQNASVNLNGWFLTNAAAVPNLWALPAITLAPYEYRLVFASAKNRADPAYPLHTSFTLQKESGYVALVRPDLSVASSFTYGAQFDDISYGILGNGASYTTGFLATPTPGLKNSGDQAANGPAEDVVVLKVATPANLPTSGGLFATTFAVTFQSPVAAGAVIRYTLDNTAPSSGSPQWTSGQSFTIAGTTTLRARVFAPAALPGAVSSRTWIQLDSSLANYHGSGSVFSSHLPVLVLDSFGFPVDAYTDPGQARPYRLSYAILLDRDPALAAPNTNRALLTGKVDFQGRCGTHVRGESSSGFPQKSYAWELWDNDNNDKKSALLGMPSESDWVLYGPYTDKTMIRDYLAYSTLRAARGDAGGMRTRFVEVFFNQHGGSVTADDYLGVYVLVEKIKRGKDRVDIQNLPTLATDAATITGGYIFKHDKPGIGNSTWSTATYGIGFQGDDPEALNSTQLNYINSYLNTFESVLASQNFANTSTGYPAYIEPDTFIDNQWWVEICKQIDGYRLSAYFAKDRAGKIRALPIWDYNLSLGNADYLDGYNPPNWYYAELGGSDYFWYPQLHADPNYEQRHWDRYWELRRSTWGTPGVPGVTGNVLTTIDGLVSELTNGNTTPVTNSMAALPPLQENAAMRQYRKWPILGNYVWPNAPGYGSRVYFNSNGNATTGEVDWMKNWLTQRLAWIDDQNTTGTLIYRPPNFSNYGGHVAVGTMVTISAYAGTAPGGYSYAAGTLYFTTDGSDPRASGGGIAGTAYGSPLTLNHSTTVRARLYHAGRWSPVTTANFTVNAAAASAANLVVSEFCYHPVAPAPGSAEYNAGYTSSNDFEYVELLNVSAGDVDLTGVSISGGITFSFASTPPGLLVLAPGARILVVGNLTPFLMRYGSGLTGKIAGSYTGHLGNSGDTIVLLAAGGQTIASVSYLPTDPWPVAAGTLGYSLVLNNPAPGAAYAAANWRASAQPGGTPGAAAGPAFSGNPNGDTDRDGQSDFLEYALGSSATSSASVNRPVCSLQSFTVAGHADNYLTLSYRRNNAADGVNYFVEYSENLTTWTNATTWVSTTQNTDGTSTVLSRANVPQGVGRQFLRLRVTP